MPTTKPRITITLTEQQHALLQALAGYQGGSMSSIIVDLLETACPVLERVVTVMEAASKAPQEMLAGLKESMERAEATVISQMQGHMDQLDIFVGAASGAGVTRSGAPALVAASPSPTTKRPPTSNRGVRITTDAQITVPKKASLKAVEALPGCTCTVTKHERMENKTCPVHFPAKRRRHAV